MPTPLFSIVKPKAGASPTTSCARASYGVFPQRTPPPLHLQVAQAIEAAYVGSERSAKSALLAYHYSEAGAHHQALGYWISAGDSAVKLCLFNEARHH